MQFKSYSLTGVLGAILVGSTLLTGCRDEETGPSAPSYPAYAEASNPRTLSTAPNGTVIYNGGFGSSIAQDPNDPTVF